MNLVMLLSLLLTAYNVIAVDIFVSTSIGKSNGDGYSKSAAMNDLEAALSKSRSFDRILLCEGDVFSGSFKATSDNIIIDSYNCGNKAGSRPVVTQSTQITTIPETVNINGYNIWSFNMSSYVSVKKPVVWSVWMNNNRYHRARYPNLINPKHLFGTSEKEFLFHEGIRSKIIMKAPKNLKGDRSYWVNATMRYRDTHWSFDIFKILSLNERNEFTVGGNTFKMDRIEKRGLFLEPDHIGELDAPGEFFYDNSKQILYVFPVPGDTFSSTWVLIDKEDRSLNGNVTTLNKQAQHGDTLQLLGKDILVQNIQISFSSVAIRASSPAVIKRVTVTDMISTGIILSSNDTHIIESHFRNIDVYGVLGSLSNTSIKKSEFYDIGMVSGYASQPAGIRGIMLVSENTFFNMGYAAVVPRRACVVENNNITNFMLTSSDGGGIYSWGDTTTDIIIRGNTIRGLHANCFSCGNQKAFGVGIYADEASNRYLIENNTIVSDYEPRGILMNDSPHNRIIGNTLINCSIYSQHFRSALSTFGSPFHPENTTIQGNVFDVKYQIPAIIFRNEFKNATLSYEFPQNNTIVGFEKNKFCLSMNVPINWTAVVGVNISLTGNVVSHDPDCLNDNYKSTFGSKSSSTNAYTSTPSLQTDFPTPTSTSISKISNSPCLGPPANGRSSTTSINSGNSIELKSSMFLLPLIILMSM